MRATNADRRGGVSRRALLGGGLGGLVALAPCGSVRAGNAPAFHRSKVGAIDVTVVGDGAFSLPLGMMLPRTPLEAAASLLGSDANSGAIRPAVNAVVVRSAGKTVLIDCGGGTHWLDGLGTLPESLEAAQLAPENIDTVIFTHAHPDHLWGVWDDFEGASLYAKASHIISSAEWDYWTDRTTIDKTQEQRRGMAVGSARILKAIEKSVRRVKPGDAVAPGLTLIATPGHTPGHMSVLIESGGQRLLVGGDVLSHVRVSFERPDWVWGGDQDSDQAIATRKRLLGMLATDRIGLFGTHLPWPGLGFVEAVGAGWRFIQT